MNGRTSSTKRETKETVIEASLNLDGRGKYEVETPVPFLNHMLELLAKHSLFDLVVRARGDLEVDAHHTVEDIGISLGQVFRKSLGDKSGIQRFGFSIVPMDEALAMVSVDISGRPHLVYDVDLPIEVVGTFDTTLTADFIHAFVNHAAITLHIKMLSGRNAHHMIEAMFKGIARALDMATRINPRVGGVPSTKGEIE